MNTPNLLKSKKPNGLWAIIMQLDKFSSRNKKKSFTKKDTVTLIAQTKTNKSGKTILVYTDKLYRINTQFDLQSLLSGKNTYQGLLKKHIQIYSMLKTKYRYF